ncbi:C39 family peptidase [Streptococcus plurextorum]|uniref:C39 family peptidase n=1 Tax=Streptococcus plurextorum TaxID=456876 RepID=UPI00041FDCDC|nr:C39 family peptidase [Streptococcus plurextorum]
MKKSVLFLGLIAVVLLLAFPIIFLISTKVQESPSTERVSKAVTVTTLTTTTKEDTETTSASTSTETTSTSPAETTTTTTNQPQAKAGEKVMLNVTQQIQRAATTCAPTTVSMLLSYKGIDVSQETLAVEMKTDTSFGTHNVNAIEVLNQHLFGYANPSDQQSGYRLATVTDVEADKALFKKRLKQNIADGYPMYYTIEVSTLYPGYKGEHNVLGIGYQMNADGTDIEYLYYLDPGFPDPVYGGLKKVTVEELLQSTTVCVEPNYAW